MKKVPIFGFVCSNPAGATGLMYFMLERLGGSVEFTQEELDSMSGTNSEEMVDLAMDEKSNKIVLTVGETISLGKRRQ